MFLREMMLYTACRTALLLRTSNVYTCINTRQYDWWKIAAENVIGQNLRSMLPTARLGVHSRSCVTHSRSRVTHSRSGVTHSRSGVTHSRSRVTHSRSCVTHSRSCVTHGRSGVTHSCSCATHNCSRVTATLT